jgi:hypothetical protein
MMTQVDKNTELLRMKTCSSCKNKILSDFAFCRWCGEKQMVTLRKYLTEYETKQLDNTRKSYETATLTAERPGLSATTLLPQRTSDLSVADRFIANHRFSGNLIQAVIKAFQSEPLKATSVLPKKLSAFVLSLFVSLILVLSAPIDAFLLAKNYIK